jgi:hypothetical protein
MFHLFHLFSPDRHAPFRPLFWSAVGAAMAVGAWIRESDTGPLWLSMVTLVAIGLVCGLLIDRLFPGLSAHPLPEEETVWEPGQVLVEFADPADARAFAAAGKVLIPDAGGMPAARTTLATIHLLAEEDRDAANPAG